MKRSAPMQRKTPLARTGFKRKEPGPFKKQLDRNTQTLVRKSAIKSKSKRVSVADGAKYLAACSGDLIERSEVIDVGIDGGGLDDLLGSQSSVARK